MKIALVTPFPDPGATPRGGVEAVAATLVDFLVRHGHECHIVAPYSTRTSTARVSERLWVHRIPNSLIPAVLDFWFSMPVRIRRCLHRIEPDVVHVHGPAAWAAFTGYPTVLTIHGTPEREIVFRHPFLGRLLRCPLGLIEQAMFCMVDHVIVINPYVQNLRRPRASQTVWEVPNPISDLFTRVPPKTRSATEPLRILWIGNSGPRKNLILAIDMARRLHEWRAPFTLHIIGVAGGESEYVARCMNIVNRYKLNERIVFSGIKNQREMVQYMDGSDVLVLTSLQETAPCVVSEALARGLYVVGPAAFGLPWMIADSRFGALYSTEPAPDPVTIARLALSSTPMLSTAARELRRRAAECYSIECVGPKTIDVYATLIAASKQ